MIKGEGLVTSGLEYRPGNNLFPIVGPYGVITKGFVYNVDESWSFGWSYGSVSWTGSFVSSFHVTLLTGWTSAYVSSYHVTLGTGWTISF
jgi:hypothetical protein